MSRFLQILEENDPNNEGKMDAAFQAKFFLYEHEIPFSSQGTRIILHSDKGDIVLEAIGMETREIADAEEDENVNASTGTYEVDKTVDDIANKPLLKTDVGKLGVKMKANRAKKERDKLANQAVDAYRKGTERIKKGLQAVKTSATQRTY